jgi:c-di-GMP-binding flagellar brake protein YcgR
MTTQGGGNKPGEMKEEREREPSLGVVDFERRKHPRFSVALPIEYWQTDQSRSRNGRTIDVSDGGSLLQISELMEIGQILRLKLFMISGPDIASVEALAQVEVVWQDIYEGKEGDYRVGVKFVEISPQDVEQLKKFLNNLEFKIPSELTLPPNLLKPKTQKPRG